MRKSPIAELVSTSRCGGSTTVPRLPAARRKTAAPSISTIITRKKYVGMANTMPDSFTPRRFTSITKNTNDHPEPHAVLVENRKRGRELCGSRRHRYAHRQDVVREERCSRHLRGELPQIVSRDHVRASSVGVGVDGLLIGDRDDREKDGDGHRNGERVHESGGAGGSEDEQDLLSRVGGRGEGVGGEDREAHGLADGLVARVGGGKRSSEEPGPPGAPGRMKGRGKGLGHGEGGF